MSDQEPFSQADLAGFAIGAAKTHFAATVAEMRRLLADTAHRDGPAKTDRPADLRRLGEKIPAARRRQALQAANQAYKEMADDLISRTQAAGEDDSDAEEGRARLRRHPVPPELIVAGIIAADGPARAKGRLGRLATACEDDPLTLRYVLEHLLWEHQTPPSTVLARGLLPSLVAAFEELIGSLARVWLAQRPEARGLDKKPAATYGELGAYESTDDLRLRALDKEVRRLIDEGPKGWNEILADKLDLRLDDLSDNWPATVEVFLRRNVIVHARGRADDKYIRLVPAEAGVELGELLECDAAYMRRALDLLGRLGTALASLWLVALHPRSPDAYHLAADVVIVALEEGRWRDAHVIASRALKRCPEELPGSSVSELRVNDWMARQEIGAEDHGVLRAQIERWQPPSEEPRYRVAQAALLHDPTSAIEALESCRRAGHGDLASFASWPLIKRLAGESPEVGRLVHADSDRIPPRQAPRGRKRDRADRK